MFIAEDTWQPQSSPQGSTLNHKCSMRLADLVQLSDIFQFFQVYLYVFQYYGLHHKKSNSQINDRNMAPAQIITYIER